MTIGLLLIPAIGGYWLLTRWHKTKYRAERDSGYHLLLRSAGVGIILVLLSHIIAFFLNFYSPALLLLWDAHIPQPFTSAVVMSLAMGLIAPFILNLFVDEDECAREAALKFGDNIELLLDQAMQAQKMVEVDLDSRKVYIGFALNSGLGKTSDTDAILMPVLSGHRDPKTLELTIDIDYLPTIRRLVPEQIEEREESAETLEQSILDFVIVIPLSEIVSARIFEREIYDASHGNLTGSGDDDMDEAPAEQVEEQEAGREPKTEARHIGSTAFMITLLVIYFALFVILSLAWKYLPAV